MTFMERAGLSLIFILGLVFWPIISLFFGTHLLDRWHDLFLATCSLLGLHYRECNSCRRQAVKQAALMGMQPDYKSHQWFECPKDWEDNGRR